MKNLQCDWFLMVIFGCLWLCGQTSTQNCFAQERSPTASKKGSAEYEVIDLKATSLRFVEANASFYSAAFQMDKQWSAFMNGPFMQHIVNTPTAKKYIETFTDQWNQRSGVIGGLRRNIDNPNIQSVVDLITEMSGQEIFVYGDSTCTTSLVNLNDLIQEFFGVIATDQESLYEYMLSLEKDRFDAIAVPNLIAGGKVSNLELALQQIDILEAILTLAINQVPPLAPLQDKLVRVEGDSGTRLVLTLSADMLPWDIWWKNPDLSDLVSKIEELMAERQIAISIGMFHEYFIFGISESPEDIDAISEPEESLLEIEEFEIVNEKSDQPIIGIGYMSDAMADANFQLSLNDYFTRNFGRAIGMLQSSLSQQLTFTEDEEELENIEAMLSIVESLPEEMEWLDEQIGQYVPEPRGQTAVAVGRSDGFETWVDYRTEPVVWDYQESLPVLEHLGGNPIGFIAARRQNHPEYFETARLIVRKVKTYLDRLVVSGVMNEEDTNKLDLLLQKVWPVLVQFADATEEDLIPALADGQFAFVINQPKITAKQWFKDMPASSTELPLIEVGEVWGVSDSEKLVSGTKRIFDVLDQVVGVVRELDENAIPEGYSIPRPESRDNPLGKNYFYPIPEDCPVPDTMAIQALVTSDFAYFTYSEPQLKQIVKKTPLATLPEFIESKENIGAIMYLNFGQLFTSLKPWSQYLADQIPGDVVAPGQQGFPDIQKSDILDLLGALEKSGEFISIESGQESGSIAHGRYFRK